LSNQVPHSPIAEGEGKKSVPVSTQPCGGNKRRLREKSGNITKKGQRGLLTEKEEKVGTWRDLYYLSTEREYPSVSSLKDLWRKGASIAEESTNFFTTSGKDELTSSTAEVTITIRDVNDEAPTFNQQEYR
jgi:hypothetical protein